MVSASPNARALLLALWSSLLLLLAVGAFALPVNFDEVTVFSGLDQPTAVRFAPDGSVFIAQKLGTVVHFKDVNDTTPVTTIDVSSYVESSGDLGLLGLAVHPQYGAEQGNDYVYLLFTLAGAASPGGRLLKVAVDPATGYSVGSTVLLEGWCQMSNSHSIGDLHFGPDGALYVSAGEGADHDNVDKGNVTSTQYPGQDCNDPLDEGGALRSQSLLRAQGPATLSGAILRLDPQTGLAMPGNPFFGDADENKSRIIAHGERNPYRFTFHPLTGEIWTQNTGWFTWEEINRIPDPVDSVVENFGWPCFEGYGPQERYVFAALPLCDALYLNDTTTKPFMTFPNTDRQSSSGIAFYHGDRYPAAYEGALFIADVTALFRGQDPLRVVFAGIGGLPDPATVQAFSTSSIGPVDVQLGPDGYIYFADIVNGAVVRIAYDNSTSFSTVDLTVQSAPKGLVVSINGTNQTTPFTVTLPMNATIELTAWNQSASGNTYSFVNWSDGGAQTHTVNVPASDLTVTATYDNLLPPVLNNYTCAEVAQRNDPLTACFLVVDGLVFDVTEVSKIHPASFHCGKNVSITYHLQHGPKIRSTLMGMAVGVVTDFCPAYIKTPVATRINTGGADYTDSHGNAWLADTFYNTGLTSMTSNVIAGTDDQEIYQNERYDDVGGDELEYDVPVENGLYDVRLHFAEIYNWTFAVGVRVFDVLIEETVVLDDYDIYADVGAETAVAKTFPVNITDGRVTIRFEHGVQNPQIAGIEVLPVVSEVPLPQPYRELFVDEGSWDVKELMVVVERDAEDLLFITGADHSLLGRIHEVGYQPHTSVFSPDGTLMYIISRDGFLSKIDLRTLEPLAVIRAGTNSRGTAINADGSIVAVGNYEPGNVVLVDTETMSVLTTIDLVEQVNSTNITSRAGALVEDGDLIYVVLKDAASVWAIDTAQAGWPVTNKYRDIGNHAGLLHDGYLTSDGKYFVVASQGSNTVWVLDTDSMNPVGEVKTGLQPHVGSGAVWGNTTFVPALGEGNITAISMQTWLPLAYIPTGGPGLFIRSYDRDPTYPYVWADTAFGPHSDEVYVIDGANLSIVQTIVSMPGKTSIHPEFTYDGNYVYVAVWGGDYVYVYDAHTFALVATIPATTPTAISSVGLRAIPQKTVEPLPTEPEPKPKSRGGGGGSFIRRVTAALNNTSTEAAGADGATVSSGENGLSSTPVGALEGVESLEGMGSSGTDKDVAADSDPNTVPGITGAVVEARGKEDAVPTSYYLLGFGGLFVAAAIAVLGLRYARKQ